MSESKSFMYRVGDIVKYEGYNQSHFTGVVVKVDRDFLTIKEFKDNSKGITGRQMVRQNLYLSKIHS